MSIYNNIIVAKYFLAKCRLKDFAPNATQLQKLLFICYGSYLSQTSKILFNEQPKAWPFGPVFPTIRKKVNTEILLPIDLEEFATLKNDVDVNELIDKVIINYNKFTAAQLSDWSHSKGSPWDLTVTRPNFKWNDSIPNEYIKEYFSRVNV